MTTLAHFACSDAICAANCCGVLLTGSKPFSDNEWRTSGMFRIATISLLSRDTMASGVYAGATTPYHSTDSMPGNPASAMVGTFGSDARRCFPTTANALSCPDSSSGFTTG